MLTVDIGITILGKYTLLKRFMLVLKVLEVLLKLSIKKFHKIMPEK